MHHTAFILPPAWVDQPLPTAWQHFIASARPPMALDLDALAESAAWIGFDAPQLEQLLQCAAQAAKNPWSTLLHCCVQTFTQEEPVTVEEHRWPPISLFPAPLKLIYALALLLCVPHVRERQRRHGIPEAITRASLADILRWIVPVPETPTRWQLANIAWVERIWRDRLFELGRLQFEFGNFSWPVVGVESAHEVWALLRTDTEPMTLLDLSGAPMGPVVDLPEDWDVWLSPGDVILHAHIPSGGPLEPEACAASYATARDFFARHFPTYQYKAICCDSWLLDPTLADYLPFSNVVAFQHDYALTRLPWSSDRQIFERVFGQRPLRLDEAPRDTALRRAVLDHVQSGGAWYNYGGIMRPGSQGGICSACGENPPEVWKSRVSLLTEH